MPVNETLLHGWFFGNYAVKEASAILFAYLFAGIPIPTIVAWLFSGTDWRLARTAACAVPFADAFKAFIPVAIVAHGAGTTIALACGVAAVIGDCFSPYLRWRGGTGSAAAWGTLCFLAPPAAAVYAIVWLVSGIASRSIVAASLIAACVSLVPLWFFLGAQGAWYATALLLLAGWGHRAALRSTLDGVEPGTPAVAPARASLALEPRQPAERLGV